MTKAEQVALGTTLAGVNQYKVFSAVMTNFKTAVKATEDALKSEGSAEKENAKYMESIQAKTQAAKAELQKFVLQGNILQKTFKAILDVGIKVLKFFNTFEGKITLISTSIFYLFTNFGKLIEKLKGLLMIEKLGKVFSALTISIKGFTNGAISASTAVRLFKLQLDKLNFNPWMLALSAIIALISALVIVTYKASKALEEHQNKLRESQSAMEESNNAIADYKSRLEEINSEFERIKEEIDEINKKDLNTDRNAQRNLNNLKAEVIELKNEQVELENLIKLEQLRNNEERKKQKKEAEKIFSSKALRTAFTKEKMQQNQMARIQGSDYSLLVGGGYLSNDRYNELNGKDLNLAQGLEVATANLRAYSNEFEKLYNKKQASKHGGVFWSDEDEKALQQAQNSMNSASAEATYLSTTLQEAVDSTDSTAKGYKEAVASLDNFYGAINNTGKATKETLGIYGDLDEEIDELDEDLANLKEEYNATDEELERSKTLLDELGLKENAFSKEIGMSSIELIRQADAWNMNEKALYEYLTALNRFDNSLDNIQSNYKILQTAIDEYNEMQGFSVDTTQSLLRMSPEYLEMLDEALSGYKSLEDSITDKIRAQALEAKQVIYNTAVERINELATKDNIESIENQSESFRSSTEDIDEQTRALDENSKETIKNAATRAYRRGATEQEVQQILYDMERQLDAVDEMVLAVGTDFSTAMGNNSKSASSTNSELKEQNSLLKQQKQILEEKKKQYDSVVSYIKKKIQDEIKSIQNEKKEQVDAIKEQIDALKDLKDEELDRIKEQIDALKDQKDVEKDFWQEKIDALKEQNEELNTQLEREKLLEDLAKARSKKVRVYKEGVGFVYTEDTKEVDKAREKIEEFDRKQAYEEQLKILENYKDQSEKNYEEQIKALEKFKDEREKLYDQQIKNLEAYQKQVEADYDARIEYFQNYLDKFTEQTDAYENETNRQLAIQLTGIDFEQQGWQTRLDNLANFVEQYNALLGDINTLSNNELSELSPDTTKRVYTQKNENDDEYDIKDTRDRPSTQVLARIGNYYSGNSAPTARDIKKELEDKQKKEAQEKSNWYAKNYGGKKASGDSYIKDDGMYLIGDSPNQELVIGSKLNGNLMNLTQGSGVVNATSTRTLAGMLNQLGFANQGVNVSNSQSKKTNINIGNISLPSVQNGKDFVDYLQNFSLQMTQEAFA